MNAIAVLAALAASAQDPEPPLDCDHAQSQIEMNLCAQRDFDEADAELNRVWRGAIAAARTSDREYEASQDRRPGFEAVLREAQRAWITFRDAHCTYEAYEEARGGSMEPMLFNGCRTRLTEARTEALRAKPQP